jgi:hypothetical protein
MKNLIANTTEWVKVAPKFSYRWMCNGIISHVKLTGADRASVDAWIEHSIATRLDWSQDAPLLVLSDHRESDLIVTPYFLQSLPRLNQTRPELMTHVAFILDKSLGARTLGATLRIAPAQANLTMRLFYQPDEAIDWLLDKTSS